MLKKKKQIKTIILKIPKTNTPTAIENIKSALDSLETSSGWAIIKKIMDDNIKYLETAILEKIDPITKKYLTNEDVEICRYKRNLNIDLRDTPANYRKQLDETEIIPKEFDPYYKTKEDIDKKVL